MLSKQSGTRVFCRLFQQSKKNLHTYTRYNKQILSAVRVYTQPQYIRSHQPLKQINLINQFSRFFANYPAHTELNMPALSPTMEKGNILQWNFKEGDKIGPGDVICEVETDKATVGFEMQEQGYIAKLILPAGTKDVRIGQLVAILVENEDEVKAFRDYSQQQAPQQVSTPTPQPDSKSQVVSPQRQEQVAQPQQQQQQQTPIKVLSSYDYDYKIIASPLAKKLAREHNIDISHIVGTGQGGRITEQDIRNFIQKPNIQQKQTEQTEQQQQKQQKKSTQDDSNNYQDIDVSNMRAVIAQRLLQSKTQIPHYYLTVNVQMDQLIQLRTQLNEISNTKISVNDFIIKASAKACIDVPEVNSQWLGDTIRQFKNADVSVAVGSDTGLITPIVFNANNKSIESIAIKMKELIAKAKENKLQPQEFIGGTFTISNLGMFGIKSFSAIINQPQACILAVGATQKQFIASEDGEKQYRVANIMNVTLSSDHRVVDGLVGSKWLQRFKFYMENPLSILL